MMIPFQKRIETVAATPVSCMRDRDHHYCIGNVS
jgi:hypothetical protein